MIRIGNFLGLVFVFVSIGSFCAFLYDPKDFGFLRIAGFTGFISLVIVFSTNYGD